MAWNVVKTEVDLPPDILEEIENHQLYCDGEDCACCNTEGGHHGGCVDCLMGPEWGMKNNPDNWKGAGPDSDEWMASRPEGEHSFDTLEAARPIEDVHDLVMNDNVSWMEAVRAVAEIYGMKGRDLARQYTEAYK